MIRFQSTLKGFELTTLLTHYSAFSFARKQNRTMNSQQKFEAEQQKYAQEYFESYRKEIEKENVIKDFRRQIFDKKNEPSGYRQYEKSLDAQQNRLNTLLRSGNKEQINKYSNKIMQHHRNKKKMFKGLDNKEIFKDYADYSAYKSNHLKTENRNYQSMDTMEYPTITEKTMEFIDTIPDDYQEKQDEYDQMRYQFPDKFQEMTLGDYGRHIQNKVNKDARRLTHQTEYRLMQTGEQMPNRYDFFEQTEKMYDYGSQDFISKKPFNYPILSTEVINQIYALYMQGWSIREISKRFGILPIRAKLHIWCRARLYHEFAPKLGIKFIIEAFSRERQFANELGTMDYGLDLPFMDANQQLKYIVEWSHERVDAQRKPQEYTKALQKLQKVYKFNKYDQVEVGIHGTENKKYLLKEWKFHTGKRSPETILKNKTFVDLMWARRNFKKVYY